MELSSMSVENLVTNILLILNNDMKNLRFRAAYVLGIYDIRKRYRKSSLGPGWITFGLIIQILIMSIVFAKLFDTNIKIYIPYIAIGLIYWNLFVSFVNDAIECFSANSNLIKQMPLNLIFYIVRIFFRNIFIFLHNIIVLPLILYLTVGFDNLNLFVFLIGNLIFFAFLFIVSIPISILGARFKDIGPIINSCLQILFYITPIMWSVNNSIKSDSILSYLIKYNPISCLFNIVRSPIYGNSIPLFEYLYIFIFIIFGILLTYILLKKYSRRIPFWV